MCGISGIYRFSGQRPVAIDEVRRMCRVLEHRGPDDEGIYTHGRAGIGMRRLSIIDLHTGHQPIPNEDESAWVVFNGEIYNHHELRRDLEARGHRFRTQSDTETIVHAYEEFGDRCVERMNGMFAFAVLDQKRQLLFLARDRLGIKPLYYFVDAQRLLFGSEIKAILSHDDVPRELDFVALDSFLTFEYVAGPQSIFKAIKKLPAGHTMTVTPQGITVARYWDVVQTASDEDEKVYCERLYTTLKSAVHYRLVSDVPLGALLSGGIDSSTIVGLMAEQLATPVETFSIGFEEDTYNELAYARQISQYFHTHHHEQIIRPDAIELTEKVIRHCDEPLADFSVFPTYLVSVFARQHVTVALSGDGGDELFAGYDHYKAQKLAGYYRWLPRAMRVHVIEYLLERLPPTAQKKGLINKAKRFIEGAALPSDLAHTRWMTFLTAADKAQLYSPDLRRELKEVDAHAFIRRYLARAGIDDPLGEQLLLDLKTYLVDDILVKVDRMSMATALEVRVPFLDYRVVELAAAIPSRLKLKGWTSKYLLKQAMAALLPASILQKKKEGFSIPIKNWLKDELKPLLLDSLSPDRVRHRGYFNVVYIDRLVSEHLAGTHNHSHKLWPLVLFEIWHSMYLD
jgi:asparagine synthase (glutamine-hydrolysing)